MDEDQSSSHSGELSEEDLAILEAFDNMELDWSASTPPPSADMASCNVPQDDLISSDEMVLLFVTEVDEDLRKMRQALKQLEPDDQLDSARLHTMNRAAHKIKGTAGAVGCDILSTIAHHIELVTNLINQKKITSFTGLSALAQGVHALETTLESLVISGEEDPQPLAALEAEYQAFQIDVHQDVKAETPATPQSVVSPPEDEDATIRIRFNPESEDDDIARCISRSLHELSAPNSFVRVDVRRFEKLLAHTEQLAELSAPLENAQDQVEKALQELQAAQARLWRLEKFVSTMPLSSRFSALPDRQQEYEVRPTSSLVARILNEAPMRTGPRYQRKGRFHPAYQSIPRPLWDALEIDRYSEIDVLIHSFNEAIADVAIASARLRSAFTQLSRTMQKQIDEAAHVRNSTLLLRLAPISTLVSRVERAVTMSAIAQRRQVRFEVSGEQTEIDQDILEELKNPFLQLVRTCLATIDDDEEVLTQEEYRIWLTAQAMGNEVSIELGFSMPVNGGAIDEVQEPLRRLNGSINVSRNTSDGLSFKLRLPRSQGAVQALLVRVGQDNVMIPFSQVHHIDYGQHVTYKDSYALNTLLGYPGDPSPHPRPFIVLRPGNTPLAVQVDEILGEGKFVVKPLPTHLRRPGITGSAIDGVGNVLLMLDLPELIRQQDVLLRMANATGSTVGKPATRKPPLRQQRVLIVDDSVSIRQSVLQSLSRVGYQVIEARDGMEALELLIDAPPDAMVLDMEMPNLNGYDLLNLMRGYPELVRVKIIMLTSRSSEKHRRRAYELGVHAYLTKPCPPDHLLETLQSLLQS